MTTDFLEHGMRLALAEAKKAEAAGEVPTGCVIVRHPEDVERCRIQNEKINNGERLATDNCKLKTGFLLARAHNQTELLKDPTAHAEMIAITQAAAAVGDWRLENTVLFVTKEPCPMCAGGIVLARIPVVVYGFADPKRGGISVFNILRHEGLNHTAEIIPDILRDECLAQFQAFFKTCRD